MLIDTSGLLCAHNDAEPFHRSASETLRNARQCLTHGYVLAEFVALAHSRRLPRGPVLQTLTDLINNPDCDVVWIDNGLHEKGMALLRSRLDKTYSLCDAVCFVLMRQMGMHEALTTVHHFEQEGSGCLLG